MNESGRGVLASRRMLELVAACAIAFGCCAALERASQAEEALASAAGVVATTLPPPILANTSLEARPSQGSPQGWLEAALEFGGSARRFAVSIDPACDTASRSDAALASSVYPSIGLRLAFFPGAISTDRWPGGIGVEASFQHHLGVRIVNRRENQPVAASQLAASVGALFRHAWGDADRGVTLLARIGWTRYDFSLGDVGNDLVPPVTYDAVHVGLSAYLPLWTRYVGLDLGGAYLGVFRVGDEMAAAYGAPGTVPRGHGYRLTAGLSGQIAGGLRWNAGFEVLGVNTAHDGKGAGFGTDPSTVCTGGDCAETLGCRDDAGEPVIGGISTTSDARDLAWRLLLGLSFRAGSTPGR